MQNPHNAHNSVGFYVQYLLNAHIPRPTTTNLSSSYIIREVALVYYKLQSSASQCNHMFQ